MALHRKGCTKIERVYQDEKDKRSKVGMQYGELIVEEKLANGYYLCRCSCGNYIITKTSNLRPTLNKCITHCGCMDIKYEKDEEYFNNIDSANKAYILGFILTDGCIGVSSSKSKRLKITLQKQDSEILEKILKELKTSSPIRFATVQTVLPNGSKYKGEVAEINICSNLLCDSLIKYGITPKKTYKGKININLIPREFRRDFVRGIVDGDGSFGIYCGSKSNKISYDGLRMVGNINTLEIVAEILKDDAGIKSKIYSSNAYHEDIKTLDVSGKERLIKTLHYLYRDSLLYLQRKYEKYLRLIKLCDIIDQLAPLGLSKLSSEEQDYIKQIIKSYGSNDYPVREYIQGETP